MIRIYWVALMVTAVAICGSTAFFVPPSNADISIHPESCQNSTDVVVPSIQTSKVVDSVSSVVAAQESCDRDYKWDGRTCVKSIVTDSYCSENYELVDGSCQIIKGATCPPGYHQSEDGECVIRVEFKVKCPPDHEWTGTKCVRSVAGVCPVGTEMEDGICVKTQTSSAECPLNFELIGSQCRQSVNTICDEDFELIDGECVRHEHQPVMYKCPDDMILEGKQCVSRIRTCPPGYSLNGTTCVNVTISCPPNAKLDANNQCVQTTCNPVAPCEEGYVFVNGRCYEIQPPTCDPNYVLINRTVCVLPCEVFEAFCPPSYFLRDGWCIDGRGDISIPVRPECSDGYSLQNNWCVKLVSNPKCTVIPPRCQPGFHLLDDECVRNVTCPAGYQLVNNRCEPQAECLPGYVLWNGECIIREPLPPIPPQCPVDWILRDGLCYLEREPTTTTPAIEITPSCPVGYTLVDRWCVPKVNPTPICQEGYFIRNGTCHQIGIPPRCPPKYFLVNNQCVCNITGALPSEPDRNPTTAPCPPERPVLLANGTCIWKDVITKPPTCPAGYVYHSDGKCHSVVVNCPHGQVLSDGSCYNHTFIRPNCPPGFTVDSSTNLCIQSIPNCPFGFERRPDGHCYPIRPVCLPGYHFRDNACYPDKLVPIKDYTTTTTPSPDGTVVTCQHSGSSCTHHITNTVSIDKPVNVDTKNENNIVVHLYENGRKVQITRNNETQYIPIIVDENDEPTESADIEIETETAAPNCCQVVSPRKCNKVGDEWQCTQRETRRCGWFCTRSTIYLKPRRTIYREPTLVMRPPPSWNRWGSSGGSIDCSGCVYGGYSCSRECYQYATCGNQEDCAYVDQRQFCQTYAGEGCAEEDGCLE